MWRMGGLLRDVGLSPPTRGNRPSGLRLDSPLRSIPAHAGEPDTPGLPIASIRVYPRPRGGTKPKYAPAAGTKGLSPPTRGNPAGPKLDLQLGRSIPAHAGEPEAGGRILSLMTVYPRPRGGTGRGPGGRVSEPGLSPPTRGNPGGPAQVRGPAGSIPAHAGEPVTWRCTGRACRVYPRPRGGTLGYW